MESLWSVPAFRSIGVLFISECLETASHGMGHLRTALFVRCHFYRVDGFGASPGAWPVHHVSMNPAPIMFLGDKVLLPMIPRYAVLVLY